MQQSLAHKGFDCRALPERARQADVRTLQERRLAGLVKRQQIPHLLVEARVGEGVRRELVAEKATDDALGVRDGIEGHGSELRRR